MDRILINESQTPRPLKENAGAGNKMVGIAMGRWFAVLWRKGRESGFCFNWSTDRSCVQNYKFRRI